MRLAEPGPARLPGQALGLLVDGRPVVVPADERPDRPPFDPAAVAYFYVAVLLLAGVVPQAGGTPVPAALAGGVLCAVAGVWSHRRVLVLGERARPQVFALAVVVGAVLTLLTALAKTPLTADGEPLPGYGAALLLLSFIGGYYTRSLPGGAVLVPAAGGLMVALGVLVFPFPAHLYPRGVFASALASAYPYFACRHLATALERATAGHAASARAMDEGAERAAYLEGRESVVGLVRQARDDALRQLRALERELDGRVAALAADRLEEVDQRLSLIDGERESSSWTTTS